MTMMDEGPKMCLITRSFKPPKIYTRLLKVKGNPPIFAVAPCSEARKIGAMLGNEKTRRHARKLGIRFSNEDSDVCYI